MPGNLLTDVSTLTNDWNCSTIMYVSAYFFVLKELGIETKDCTADILCERSFVRVHHRLVLVLV